MKIAILGGSFDPIHNAHLQIAKSALKQMVDEVWFMPTASTPLKDRTLSDAHHRLAMIKAAIKPYRHMHVCTMEIDRGGASYTIDTVKACIAQYPQHHFYWLIGSDQEAQLKQWKGIDELCSLITICVYPRGEATPLHQYPVRYMNMEPLVISSTLVRQNDLTIVPAAVRRYIGQHALYLEVMVAQTMTAKRFAHCQRVANLCVELAKIHHVNPKQAYLAGMLHDVCKEWPYEKARIWMEHLEPAWLDSAPAIWHGFIASRYVNRYYRIDDKAVAYAIRWHVLGSDDTKLAMILFVSDKLEIGRDYDSSKEIALCKRNLKQGYLEVKRQQLAYVAKTHKKETAVNE